MASATVAALERWPSRQTIIIADDEPTTWRELYSHIAEVASAQPPQSGGRPGFLSFRVRNSLAKDLLGWKPFYRSYRVGLAR